MFFSVRWCLQRVGFLVVAHCDMICLFDCCCFGCLMQRGRCNSHAFLFYMFFQGGGKSFIERIAWRVCTLHAKYGCCGRVSGNIEEEEAEEAEDEAASGYRTGLRGKRACCVARRLAACRPDLRAIPRGNVVDGLPRVAS